MSGKSLQPPPPAEAAERLAAPLLDLCPPGLTLETLRPRLVALLDAAPFLAHFLRRHPPYLQEMALQRGAALAAFETTLQEIGAAPAQADFPRRLRILKTLALLRLCLADLSPGLPIRRLYENLSRLADACIAAAMEVAASQSRDPSLARQLGAVAVGKLGGNELNLASDIDLIFVFPESEAGHESGGRQTFFSALVETITAQLSELSDEGRVWRVDLRLRPDGGAGALATGMKRLANYARERARTWERASLIKARWVAGPTSLRRDFYRHVGPFIYRRYLDFSALTEVQALRREIGRGAGPIEGDRDNLKTGPGGIREIELLTQVWQLVYGGRFIPLQTGQTTRALFALAGEGLMPAPTARRLVRAYLFLRRVEHGLHLAAFRPTFAVPAAAEEIEALARRCHLRTAGGRSAGQRLLARLENTRREVRQLYQASFFDLGHEPTPQESRLAGLFFDRGATQAAELPPPLGEEIAKVWPALQPESLLRRSGKGALSAYRRLWPKLVLQLQACPPQLAALPRLADFFQASAAKETLFTLLLSRPEVRQALLSLFANSPFLSRTLIQQPALIESLALALRPGRARAARPLRQEADRILETSGDAEVRMDEVRRLVQEEMLRTAFQDFSGLIGVEEVGRRISTLAEESIRLALLASLEELTAGAPEPFRVPLQRELQRRFAVLAFGRLAGQEMGYQSDLDLVFVVDASLAGTKSSPQGLLPDSWPTWILDSTHSELLPFFIKLGQRMITFLSARSSRGVAFSIDTRLRPSGGQGPLACTQEAFLKYHRQSAPWEKLALLRCRPVAGGEGLCQTLQREIAALISQWQVGPAWLEEMLALRQRQQRQWAPADRGRFNLKFGAGGIFDIRLLVQLLQILCRRSEAAVNTANTLQALADLAGSGHLKQERAAALHEAYLFWWRLENWLRLRVDRPADDLPLAELQEAALEGGSALHPSLAQVCEMKARVEGIFAVTLKEVQEHEYSVV